MSIDYALWRWRGEPSISRGLCYLLLCENAEIPEVEVLDTVMLSEELEAQFPELCDADGDPQFNLEFHPTGLLLETHSGTPDEVLYCFLDFAKTEKLVLFDPQTEEITARDQEAFEKRLEAIRTDEDAWRWQREIAELSSQAEQGDPKAIVELGNRYCFGEGVRQDYARAAELYSQAAGMGNTDGIFNLASCHRLGQGVEQDIDEAIRLYECAMEEDKIFAPFALGELFADGKSCPPHPERAIHYFQIALENGHQDAPRELRKLGALPPLRPHLRGGNSA